MAGNENSSMKFYPWVGSEYSNAYYGKRILVLGESHYCQNESDAVPSITTDVLRGAFDANAEFEGYMNTYTKFARALDGTDMSRTEQEKVWQRVIFYNYVQFPIAGTRMSPTVEEFRNSEEAFFEILEKYRPEAVIVWGKRLYNNLPKGGEQGPDVKDVETWVYSLNDGTKVHLLPITHPSAGFSPEEWHEVIVDFLRQNRL